MSKKVKTGQKEVHTKNDDNRTREKERIYLWRCDESFYAVFHFRNADQAVHIDFPDEPHVPGIAVMEKERK